MASINLLLTKYGHSITIEVELEEDQTLLRVVPDSQWQQPLLLPAI